MYSEMMDQSFNLKTVWDDNLGDKFRLVLCFGDKHGHNIIVETELSKNVPPAQIATNLREIAESIMISPVLHLK